MAKGGGNNKPMGGGNKQHSAIPSTPPPGQTRQQQPGKTAGVVKTVNPGGPSKQSAIPNIGKKK